MRGILSILSCAFMLVPLTPALATPEFYWVFPAGGRRGAVSTVQVHGAGLSHLSGVICTGDGTTIEMLPLSSKPGQPPGSDSVRSLRISISGNATLGKREIRLYDSTGMSEPRGFDVGQWPEILESEPNDSPETANEVQIPVTINAKIQTPSDADCYSFHAKAGQQLACIARSESLYVTLGDGPLKGCLEVLDRQGNVLAENHGQSNWDPILTWTVPQDGDYIVRFRDYLWRGGPTAAYRLTIGPVPYTEALYPSGGRRGSTVNVTAEGLNFGGRPWQAIPIAADDPRDEIQVGLRTPQGETNQLPFQLGDYPEVLEHEPNDTDAEANPVPIPVTINGQMDHDGDRDCFRFHAAAKQRLIIEVFSSRGGSPMDPYLTLRDSKGKVVSENDDWPGRGRDPLIDFTPPADGDYVVEVRDVNESSGPNIRYRLMIGPPRQDFALTVTPDVLAVPIGGAALVNVRANKRWGWDGEIRLVIDGLPPGFHASYAAIGRGSDHATLTITPTDKLAAGGTTTASFTSPPAPALVRVFGYGFINGQDTPHQAKALQVYTIQNQQLERNIVGPFVLQKEPDSVAIAITSPEIPINAGEQVTVTVHIERATHTPAAGFQLRAEGLPQGITAANVDVPAGADHTTMVLKAAKGAPSVVTSLAISAIIPGPEGKNGKPVILGAAPAAVLRVIGAIPFEIALLENSAAIGRGLPASIHVRITRKDGFDGPVYLGMSSLPAGIVADPAQVPPKSTEGEIRLRTVDARHTPPGQPAAMPPVGAHEVYVVGMSIVGKDRELRISPAIRLQVN